MMHYCSIKHKKNHNTRLESTRILCNTTIIAIEEKNEEADDEGDWVRAQDTIVYTAEVHIRLDKQVNWLIQSDLSNAFDPKQISEQRERDRN